LLSLAAATAVVALVASGLGTSEDDAPSTWLAVVLLALGVVLLFLAARGWRGRPRRGEPPRPQPRWMQALDRVTSARALGTGVTLGGVNPKNILLIMAGEAAIAQTGISTTAQVGVLALFVVVASLGVGVPVIVSLVFGVRSRALLDRFKDWMVANTSAMMAVVLLVIGVLLIADAVSAFTA
jgi:hypothetical protein